MYMVRQLANTLGLADKLHTSGEKYANPGSVSIPLTIAERGVSGRVLIAGFGAGLSASAAIVTVKSRD
jgi:3-oxoacyl-[acyl-carrier-protein] synthase III